MLSADAVLVLYCMKFYRLCDQLVFYTLSCWKATVSKLIINFIKLATDGIFTFVPEPQVEVINFLNVLITLTFVATDNRGGRTEFRPIWEVCGCMDSGLCNYDKEGEHTGRIHVSNEI